MNIKNFFQSDNRHKKILCVIGAVIVALIIFQAGVFVGFHKAAYSYGWGEKYYKTFGERGERWHRMNMGPSNPLSNSLSNSHGTIGKIISVALPSIIIEDRDGIEKTVMLTDDTIIKSFRNEVEPSELQTGDAVVIIGAPNEQAEIEARLVRILPQAPTQANVGTATVQ